MFVLFRILFLKKYIFVFLLLIPQLLVAETTLGALYKYAINLESSENKKEQLKKLKNLSLVNDYKVYQSEVSLGRRKSFYRLRVGFFKTKKEASLIAENFKSKYPKLWVDRVHKKDQKKLRNWLLSSKRKKLARSSTKQENNSINKEEKARRSMARAKKAMIDKKYRLAAGIYARVIRLNTTEHHKDAMEFLGLARERNGQLIHARSQYRLYLKKYHKGEDSLRVRQRLLSLKTALLRPRKKLRKTKSKSSDWRVFGSVMQFYREDSFDSNLASIKIETLSSNVNVLARKKTDSVNIKSQFNASHLSYLNSSKESKVRINRMFVDVADINNKKSIRFGRQSQNKGGVLGKMDGVWLDYRFDPKWKLNFVAGFPVETGASNSSQSDRPFAGISADIGTIKKYWNFNIYTINQKVGSLTDRNAVGGEIRYRKAKQNHFALIDYDIHFSELNTFFYVGNWRFDNNAAVIFTVNQRNSPILTTTNSIQSQTTPSIEALLLTYTEDELTQIAKDRTAKYNSTSVSTSLPLSKAWTFSADATVSSLSSTPASAGVAAVDGTGNEYFYSAQFIGYNVFSANELSRYQIRIDDTKTFERRRLSASSRFKLKNKKWRLRPKVTVENKIHRSGGTTNIIAPSLRVDYKLKKRFKLEVDLSYELAKTDFPISITEKNYYLSAGFIWDF